MADHSSVKGLIIMKILASIGRAWRFLPPRLRDRYHRLPLPLRKFLNRTLLDETPQLVAVQSGLLAGAHLYISPRLESGYYLGTWELEVQEMLAHFVRPGMKVFAGSVEWSGVQS